MNQQNPIANGLPPLPTNQTMQQNPQPIQNQMLRAENSGQPNSNIPNDLNSILNPNGAENQNTQTQNNNEGFMSSISTETKGNKNAQIIVIVLGIFIAIEIAYIIYLLLLSN